MSRARELAFLGVALALLAGCNGSSGASSGSSGGGGSVQPPAAPVSVALTPTEATLPTGGTLPFAATVTGAVNTAVTWSASLGTITPAGVYTAPSVAGVATLKATSVADPTKSASATVRITAPEIGLSITPATANLIAGGSQWFTATVTGTANTAVTWTCSASTINQQGLFAAPAQSGTVRVTATSVADPTKTATATVQVTAPTVGITVTPTTVRLAVGESHWFTADVTGTLNTAVTWSCSAGAITPQGLFTTPPQAGEVIITATLVADPSKTATATATVVPAVGLSLSPASAQLEPGESRAFTATVTGSANTAVLWSCTRGTITPDGVYTAPSTPGTATLTATSVADPKKSASATLLIKTAPVTTAISVSPTSAYVSVGGSQAFTATVTGTANTAVTWSCTAGSITAGGVFTAPATAGTVTVTARSVADPAKSASATVTVQAAGMVAVAVSPAVATLNTGGSQAFAATVTGTANTAVTWSCTAGSITAGGVFTAPATAGTVTVTARSVADPAKSATATVTVQAAGVVAVAVSPAVATLNTGGSQAFTATVTGTANTAVTWSCTAGSITAGGVFTAPAEAGTVTVTARSVADPAKSATATVSVSVPCVGGLPVGTPSSIVQAAATGHALTGATAEDFLSATLATLEVQRKALDPVLARLYNLNADGSAKSDGTSLTSLDWNPTHDSCSLGATFGINAEVLISNATSNGSAVTPKGLAVAGEMPTGKTRYMVMGSNPMSALGNAQMDQFMLNAIAWLSGKPAGSDLKVAIVFVVNDTSAYFPFERKIRSWLTTMYGTKVTFNAVDALDASLDKVITDGYDLVITNGELLSTQDLTTCFNGLKALVEAGKPLLYLKADGDLDAMGTQIFNLFQVTFLGDNYWSRPTISGGDGRSLMGRLPSSLASVKETLTRLQTGTFDFGLATWQDSPTETAAYNAQFGNGAMAAKAMMNGLDASGRDLFASCGQELPKLLALLGDRLRQDFTLPLKTATASPKAFLRAYFADHLVYNTRALAPAQKDLGTFSREDFSTVTPVTRTISQVSRPNFRATGAYALPGRAFRVTRLDSSAVNTAIYINTQRSASTKEWEDGWYGGFARPKYLKSTGMPIKPGQTLTLTSSYGGPIQISYDQKDLPVQFRFEHVGEHPFWNGPEDNATFAAQLAEAKYDWVEVATPGFEMHSKLDRFKSQTLTNPLWNAPTKLAETTQRYTYNYTHILAGFQGDGIDKEPEIYGWAQAHGITLPTTDTVKHMNADVPTCGWGCSGNPYDAGWAFSPLGHGDLHELGHGIQNSKSCLVVGGKTYDGHAATNYYSYYAKSRFYDETGSNPSGGGMPFGTLYKQLQAAYQGGARVGTFSDAMENHLSTSLNIYDCYAFYVQYMMQVRDKGLLNNGWHMIGRIHAVTRVFDAAKRDQATWDREKGKWGFDQVSHAEVLTFNNTDLMAVMMSYVTGLDIRDYMAMWGFRISPAAASQIASYRLPAAERVFYAMPDAGWVEGALSTRVDRFLKLRVDGTTAWPYDSTLKVSKTTYTTAEAVSLTFTNTMGHAKDWIGIYPATEQPDPATFALKRQYLNGATSGTVTFSGLPAGSYKAYLCADDEDVAISSVSFTVR